MDPAFISSLQAESWALYGVAIFIYGLRLFTRIYYNGFRQGMQSDEIFMLLAMLAYTTLIVSLNMIVVGGGSNLFRPEEFATFTPLNIKERIKGSKLVIVSEQAMLITIWAVKTCMLIFYSRLTSGLHARRAVKALAIYVVMGFIACELTFFFACRPFKGYWAVPPPDPQCATLVHYATVNAIFNISSDVVMMFIPMPLLIASKLPMKQKVAICTIFMLGVFVIIAAILTKIFNLSNIYSPVYMKWYIRESSTSIYVSNIPLIWPLLRRIVPGLASSISSSAARSRLGYSPHGASAGATKLKSTATEIEMKRPARLKKSSWDSGDSQEQIVTVEDGVIRQEVTVTIESEKRSGWENCTTGNGFVTDGGLGEYTISIQSGGAHGSGGGGNKEAGGKNNHHHHGRL
ncbi:hypothetical protein FN846DRAFT_577565 [Sphaerosporella brunnea]|uniref:Rhodopsin domain-containing protein n=1 Tax=Sphaerosporella brunnea TaxID=1250544 RepID=A0A5J5EBZ0_9PEZI|nr:hypothetical protein FN846DRAFT_577565 [Sphaerosporella brunnea]